MRLMQGSVRRRDRGVWEVRIYLGRDVESGKKRYQSRTVRGSKREAERLCRELVAEAEEGQAERAADSDLQTVSSWLDEWWVTKRTSIAPTTASSWGSSVDYLKSHVGDMALHDLRVHHLESMYQRLIDGGLSAARVQKVHTVASVAFKAAVRWELIGTSPAAAARPPAVGRKEPVAPSVEEVVRILEAASEDPDLLAFLIVAANTGARRGEICALRWCDVDLDDRALTISRSVSKGSGGGAVVTQTKTGVAGRVAISEQATTVLRELLVRRRMTVDAIGEPLSPTAYLWSQDPGGSRPIYPDTISSRFSRARKRAGVGHVELRQFRHFAATQLLTAGVDVRTVAGRLRHARPAMTLDRYAAWVPARDRDAADLLDNLGV